MHKALHAWPIRLCYGALSLLSTLSACGRAGSRSDVPVVVQERSGDTMIGQFNVGLQELVERASPPTMLAPDRIAPRSSVDTPFLSVADFVVFEDGSLAVLDSADGRIVLLGSDGTVTSHIGRPGPGPGEFEQPLALTRLGDDLVVLAADHSRVFTRIRPDGRVLAVRAAPAPGDWRRAAVRGPLTIGFRLDDVTRRLGTLGLHIVHLLYPDELHFAGSDPPRQFTGALVRYDSALQPLDTLVLLPGPPLRLPVSPGSGFLPVRDMIVYGPRGSWTSWDDWLAYTDGASGRIVAISYADRRIVILRWPSVRRPLRKEERLQFARWTVEYDARLLRGVRRNLDRASASELRRSLERHADQLAFTDVVPEVTEMFGLGKCLWVVPFSAEDSPSGASRTLIGFDIDRPGIVGAVRLTGSDGHIRAFVASGIYTVRLDTLGVATIERYALPLRVHDLCGVRRGVRPDTDPVSSGG